MNMIFEREGKASIANPTSGQVRRGISALRSYGPSSFASLTRDDGTYLQVGGGGGTCLLELYQADTAMRFRAFQDAKHPIFVDGTLLVFSAGEIPMQADEWFRADQISEVFLSFLNNEALPVYIHWRSAPGFKM